MAQRREIAAVYAAAVVQGIVLVTFPAVSAVLTSPAHYGLTTGQYGTMFVPQAVTAVLASLLGAGLTRRAGGKRVLLLGLVADLLSMVLLFGSQFVAGRHALAYGILLAATACLGCGFGFVVPALNTFTAAFFPAKVDGAILTLNALLGLGTALAPVFAALFVGFGFWWGLPVLMSLLTLGLLGFTGSLPLNAQEHGTGAGKDAPAGHSKGGIPARFWVYASFALVYGVCETMNANWASVYLSGSLGASPTLATLALTVFWVSVTGGRVLFAALERWISPAWIYRGLPGVIAGAFLLTSAVPKGHATLGLVCFGLAGLGCSALLPLVVSFGQQELTAMGAAVAGGLIGFYQLGYGLAAFGVGPLHTWAHLDLPAVYRGMTAAAIGLEVLAILTVGRRRPGAA